MTRLKFPSKQLDNINIKIRIQSLRSLIDIMKIGIQKSKEKAKEKLQALSNNVEDEGDLHELRTEEEIFNLEFINYFKGDFTCSQIENTATYSIIPFCYMLFETNLVAFAKIAKEHYFLDLKYSELTGGKTEKIKTYLSKLARINISSIGPWVILKDLETIRNCIVHNEGKVNSAFREKEKINSLTKKYTNDLSVGVPLHESENYLIIRFSLCDKFLESLDQFFDDLIGAFGFNQNFYFGSEASQKVLDERMNAKNELDRAIEKAKEIYSKRMESL